MTIIEITLVDLTASRPIPFFLNDVCSSKEIHLADLKDFKVITLIKSEQTSCMTWQVVILFFIISLH